STRSLGALWLSHEGTPPLPPIHSLAGEEAGEEAGPACWSSMPLSPSLPLSRSVVEEQMGPRHRTVKRGRRPAPGDRRRWARLRRARAQLSGLEADNGRRSQRGGRRWKGRIELTGGARAWGGGRRRSSVTAPSPVMALSLAQIEVTARIDRTSSSGDLISRKRHGGGRAAGAPALLSSSATSSLFRI
ncbi:unnamed protein product, partial [Urochloa humidicola]